jgi:hypothetical protein
MPPWAQDQATDQARNPDKRGLSEFAALYEANYGEPRLGTKVFIVTCQTKNGWKGMEHETNEIVPAQLEGDQGTSEPGAMSMTGAPGMARPANFSAGGLPEPAKTENGQEGLMYKGCTLADAGPITPAVSHLQAVPQARQSDRKAAGAGFQGRREPDKEAGPPDC